MAGARPATDDRPFGMSECTIAPLATDLACHPGNPASRSNPGAIRAR
ncbi:hypothetical protein [Thalassospira sp. MCCC 1A03138]|nr:hypothetical protein [Thalassospira sp. MCCC 1A03138]